MKHTMRILAAALAAFVSALPCAAWEDHARLGRIALGSEAWASGPVEAESLERFLEAEKSGIAALLSSFEASAAKDLDYYPPLPAALAFKGEGNGAELRAAFIAALRLNPDSKLILYVKPDAGAARTRPSLPIDAVDPFDQRFVNMPFEALAEGEAITALEVLATASDEPDYGLDCGLYEDNGTEAGKRYGLGAQPFGNPALDYGSQAPLHMAFAHENPIIAKAASYTQLSLADYRFRLFDSLARFAFAEGHPYWGWRFAGWALHYVEDLCQPYHARVMPGKSSFGLILLSVFGSERKKDDAMIFLSNRHSLVEDYAYRAVAEDSPGALGALAGGGLRKNDGYRAGWLYDVVAMRAYDRARKLDRLLVKGFPERYVADPSYDYGLSNVGATREFDPYGSLRGASAEKAAVKKAAELDAQLGAIFADIGAYAREYAANMSGNAAR